MEVCYPVECMSSHAHSLPEAARVLETYKAYEKKPADAIMERPNKDYLGRVCVRLLWGNLTPLVNRGFNFRAFHQQDRCCESHFLVPGIRVICLMTLTVLRLFAL